MLPLNLKRLFLTLGLLGVLGTVAWFLLGSRHQDLPTLQSWIREEFREIPRISPSELSEWMSDTSRPAPLLLDVRTEAEFAISHLPGAQRVDPTASIRSLLSSLPSDRRLVLYCSIGYRSSQTAEQLMRLGRTNVIGLDGSIFAWANAGLPLVSNNVPTVLVRPFSDSYSALLKPEHRAALPKSDNWFRQHLPQINPVRVGLSLGWMALLLGWESFRPFFLYFRGKRFDRVQHGGGNICLGLLNTAVVSLVFAALWQSAAALAAQNQIGLLYRFALPSLMQIILAVLLLDLWTYTWHRLNHDVPFFWWFHRVHHSEKTMDVTSASRFHLGEISFSSLLRIPLILLLGLRFRDLVLYETILFFVVQFHHANIRLPAVFERVLGWFIVTPAIHRVHHSRRREETDTNYASLLSLWDRVFGTSVCVADPQAIRYGLREFDAPSDQTVQGMLTTPLRDERAGEKGG
ncbi:MAG TPA: sterol desaturase family protein [Roseimicrobium sp.]|nr:sterol desaturase family protein [Roseimicrobium sp.]